jgi:hypothetical protein
LFEAGSPTTDLYKRRKLGPVMEVGEALEREWWPSIQPFTGVDLRSDVDRLMQQSNRISFFLRKFQCIS